MSAKALPSDVSEATEDKANNLKNSSENTVISVDIAKEAFDVRPDKAETGQESQRLKKSSFQITRIIKTSEAGDNADDPDDVTSTDDMVLSVRDASKSVNSEIDALSLETVHSPCSIEDMESLSSYQKHVYPNLSRSMRPRPSDINSRFKIVKIESNKPLKRGRWMCLEFVDPPHLGESLDKSAKHHDSESTNSCIASQIYYLQVEKDDPSNNPFAAAIIYSNGQPSLEPNPLPLRENVMSQSCSNPSESLVLSLLLQQQHDSGIDVMKQMSCLSSEFNDREGDSKQSSDQHPIPSLFVAQQPPNSWLTDAGHRAMLNGLDCITKDEDRLVIRTGSEPNFGYSRVSENASPLFTIVASSANSCASGFAENEVSGGICALDNKIEQAMDLVKSHLMFAVHEEVELLKEQIKELTIKKSQLEYENTVLRASATQETLGKLHGSTSSTGLS